MTVKRVLKPLQIYDISLVDIEKAEQRDPDAIVEIVKAADLPAVEAAQAANATALAVETGDLGTTESVLNGVPPEQYETVVSAAQDLLGEAAKATFTADQRKHLADTGAAMPDGSFPIRNATDLHNAMQAIGRAKNPAAAKAHIRKRAKALGLESELTEAFKAEEVEKAGAEFSKKNRGILSSILHGHTAIGHALGALMGSEADEPEHAAIRDELMTASRQLMSGSPMQVQKAEEPAASGAEEDDMPTLDEIGALLTAQLSPFAERLTALEEAQKAAAATPSTPAAPTVPELTEEQKARLLNPQTRDDLDEAIRFYEARKAGATLVPSADDAFKGAYRLVNEDGWERVEEACKASVPMAQRPTMRQALRMLNGRNLRTGYFPLED